MRQNPYSDPTRSSLWGPLACGFDSISAPVLFQLGDFFVLASTDDVGVYLSFDTSLCSVCSRQVRQYLVRASFSGVLVLLRSVM